MRVSKVLLTALTLAVSFLLGVVGVGGIPLAGPDTSPLAALITILGALALMPVLVTNLPFAVGTFLIWLVVEDLVRKLSGNDIRVYFVKDLLFLAILIALFLDVRAKGTWKTATGQSRIPLYLMICWALIMSIPTGMADWRLPAIGLRLDFMYVPLTAVGFLLAKDSKMHRKWLGRLAILAGVASAVGIAQAVIGPEFLDPGRPTPGLKNLVLTRGLDGSGTVYRPTGTFVDPSRFTSITLVGLAAGLAALSAQRLRVNPWVLMAVAASGVAVWVSGGRGGFVTAVALLIVFATGRGVAQRRIQFGHLLGAAGSLILAMVLVSSLQPLLLPSRADWYRATLDPGSSENEWAFRFEGYGGDTLRGIALGGVIGQGTGKESIGQQYISGGEDRSIAGLLQVEGGYASVAVEWGIIGLLLWTVWTTAWVWRLWSSISKAQRSPLAMSGMVLFTWTVFFLFIGFFSGLQVYQNYVANAFFWLFSGMVFALPQAVHTVSKVSREIHHAR